MVCTLLFVVLSFVVLKCDNLYILVSRAIYCINISLKRLSRQNFQRHCNQRLKQALKYHNRYFATFRPHAAYLPKMPRDIPQRIFTR